jgi:hypothetical protein
MVSARAKPERARIDFTEPSSNTAQGDLMKVKLERVVSSIRRRLVDLRVGLAAPQRLQPVPVRRVDR